jgi:hypothetical protein
VLRKSSALPQPEPSKARIVFGSFWYIAKAQTVPQVSGLVSGIQAAPLFIDRYMLAPLLSTYIVPGAEGALAITVTGAERRPLCAHAHSLPAFVDR